MDKLDEIASEPGNEQMQVFPRLQVGDWIWRPWYAKLYWAAELFYWSLFLISWQLGMFREFFHSEAADYLGLILHPFTAAAILGFGFVRAFLTAQSWEGVEGEGAAGQRRKSIGGLMNPHADPLDPRYGMNWVGSPRTRARVFRRHWP